MACNKSHSNLSQCVHPLDIGIHDCEEDNIAGVICLKIAPTTVTKFNTPVTNKNSTDTKVNSITKVSQLLSTTLTNTSVINKSGADTKVNSNKSQSVLFGSVGAALAVGAIATVAVVGIAVLLGKKQRKRRSVSLTIILSIQFYFNY